MKECPECRNGSMAPKSLCDWCCGVGVVCESCNEPQGECTCCEFCGGTGEVYPECTCYEVIAGAHQMGCPFYGVKPSMRHEYANTPYPCTECKPTGFPLDNDMGT